MATREDLVAERSRIYRDAGSIGGLSSPDHRRLKEIEQELRKVTEENTRTAASKLGKGVQTRLRQSMSGSGVRRPTQTFKVADIGPTSQSQRQAALGEVFTLAGLGSSSFFQPTVAVDEFGASSVTGVGVSPGMEKTRFGPRTVAQRPSGGTRSLNMLNGLSLSDIKTFYLSLSDDELVKVQHDLVEAGLISERVRLGFRDPATADGLTSLLEVWMTEPDRPIAEILAELKADQAAELDAETRKLTGEAKAGEAGGGDVTKTISITDGDTLGRMIDTVAQDLFGENLDPERKAQLVSRLQQQERDYGTSAAAADFQVDQAATTPAAASDLDKFMTALIGQESGGDPNVANERTGAMGLGQIMPENWDGWARQAGADPGDFSEGNQRRVIKYKLAQYYNQYGNWRDVAVAWYSGQPTTAWSAATLDRGQGPGGQEPSMNAYADQVLGRMMQRTGAELTTGGTPGLRITERVTMPDDRTRIEAELKAMDPERYFGTAVYKQASNFFSLLRGPE